MVRWLNNAVVTLTVLLSVLFFSSFAQSEEEVGISYNEYKTEGDYSKFKKRAQLVAAWQINELKNGALVVRLKTNKTLIDALKADGNTKLATEKAAETYIINKNTMQAYRDAFTFCKTYFMYSSASDSLLKGVRSGIFLDSNLQVDPKITLNEKFYCIAERDFAYNSSIGFVKQDTARFITETGNPVKMMGAVLKNKYGHQLKKPFPFYAKDNNFAGYSVPGKAYGIGININGFNVFVWIPFNDTTGAEKRVKNLKDRSQPIDLKIKKELTYRSLYDVVEQLNANLLSYYRRTPAPDAKKMNTLVLPYLY